MYMVIYAISGYNSCGQVGPTMSNIVISMDPSDVSRIARYTASDQQVNTTPAALLTLNDIISGCSTITMTEASTNGAIQNLHAMDNDYNRCFPALAIPTPQVESLGLPYYRHCGQDNARLGLFDPPGAVPPVNALLPITSAASATSTSTPQVQLNYLHQINHRKQPPQISLPYHSKSRRITIRRTLNFCLRRSRPNYYSIASSIISAVPGDLKAVVEGQTASLEGVPITISSPLVQLAPSGLDVANVDGYSSQSISDTIPTAAAVITTVAPSHIATLGGGEVISAVPGASTIIVAGQTITSGAPATTLSGSNTTVTFGPQGLVVQASDGLVSTYSIPAAAPAPVPTPAISQSAIATLVGGKLVSAIAGALTLIVGSQTLSESAIATLGAAGLTVQYPGGITSTIPLPTQALLATPAELSITEIQTSEIIIYSSDKPVSTYYSTLTDITSITEIRTSEFIVYSSGKAITTFYSVLTNIKDVEVSSKGTSNANEPNVLAIETGNGNASSTSTESAGAYAITNIVFDGGVEKLMSTLVNRLRFAGLLGIWGLLMTLSML
ncbi:hypothetical protein OCU04_003869 [Sclerotinia nivalis]|uniref:Uncharacterized protein n=1 Tax=Sclerotinia nivalis TaxID=352851 RepID=A0A9X0AST5_9HELO|nr:hypothetical protein OCU04_003869 [Sclerotinia nivalis]